MNWSDSGSDQTSLNVQVSIFDFNFGIYNHEKIQIFARLGV